jgi:hypothetical protein
MLGGWGQYESKNVFLGRRNHIQHHRVIASAKDHLRLGSRHPRLDGTKMVELGRVDCIRVSRL